MISIHNCKPIYFHFKPVIVIRAVSSLIMCPEFPLMTVQPNKEEGQPNIHLYMIFCITEGGQEATELE